MSLSLVTAQKEHVREVLERDPTSKYLGAVLTDEGLTKLGQNGWTFSILSEGRAIMVGGIAEYWPGRGELWAFVDHTCGRQFVGVHRKVANFVDVCQKQFRRIEAAVLVDFMPAHRWVRMLGFRLEAERLEAYSMDGQDYSLYSRVRQ